MNRIFKSPWFKLTELENSLAYHSECELRHSYCLATLLLLLLLLSHFSRVRLSDPMDCSPPGSSVHGIFQAGVLEWGAIAF